MNLTFNNTAHWFLLTVPALSGIILMILIKDKIMDSP